MKRQTAILLTIASVLLCGLPGIGIMCFAAFGVYGANLPGFYEANPDATPQQLWLGAGTLVCMGLVLLFIPVLVGVLSFKASSRATPASAEPPSPIG